MAKLIAPIGRLCGGAMRCAIKAKYNVSYCIRKGCCEASAKGKSNAYRGSTLPFGCYIEGKHTEICLSLQ